MQHKPVTDNIVTNLFNKSLPPEQIQNFLDRTSTYQVNARTATYHAHDLVSEGKKNIIAHMLSTDTVNYKVLYQKLSSNEVNFQIKLSTFIGDISISQQKRFAELLSSLSDLYLHNVNKPLSDLPTTFADIRRLHTDGHYSVSKQTPIPDVIFIKGHSFVSLTDCIADFLMRNSVEMAPAFEMWKNYLGDVPFHYDHKCNLMGLFTCNKSVTIVRNANQRMINQELHDTLPLIPVFIKFWSDDFDPNKSTKSNRQSVWIKTCTIFTSDKYGKKIQRTYPISLSKKGCDHEVVEERFSNELHELKFGKVPLMYSRAHRRLVCVHAELFCVMNDQPERRGNLKLSFGNAAVHGRFGYIIDGKQSQGKIRSCCSCTQNIITELDDFNNKYNNIGNDDTTSYISSTFKDPDAISVSYVFYQFTLFW